MKTQINVSLILILALAIIILGFAKEAPAQTPNPEGNAAAFYKGKTITFIVPFSPGGGYDTFPRLMAARCAPGGRSLVAIDEAMASEGRDLGIAMDGEPGRYFDSATRGPWALGL